MPSAVEDRQLGQAVLDSVQYGSYPESEDVISAEVPPTAIPSILKLLGQAREGVKGRIQDISKDSAPDIDGWIAQAKQLRQDIELAHNTSSCIVEKATEAEKSRGHAKDAASKVALLEGEVVFTNTLSSVLERIRKLQRVLDTIQQALLEDRTVDVSGTVVEAATDLENIRGRYNTRGIGILQAKLTRLRGEVEESLLLYWNKLLHVEEATRKLSIQQEIHFKSTVTLYAVVDALGELGLLEDAIGTLCKSLEDIILLPRLQWYHCGGVGCIVLDRDELRVTGPSDDASTEKLFDDLSETILFLKERLPRSVLRRVSDILMPSLVSRIQSEWLSLAVPSDLEAMGSLQSTVRSVILFGEFLEKHQWPGKAELVDWTQNIPRFWLKKRRESLLDQVRSLLVVGPKGAETVERVETQLVAPKEGVLPDAETKDDWNVEWSDDEPSTKQPPKSAGMESSKAAAEDDDVAAWGLDEINSGEGHPQQSEPPGDGNDAWGWGEDEDVGESSQSAKMIALDLPHDKSNGYLEKAPCTEKEVTLKETYNITALPKEILEIITQAVTDAESLAKPEYPESPIASAATGLLVLPGLVLTMFRASAPSSYSLRSSGNMFLYNDSLWLTERLQDLSWKHTPTRLGLSADIQALSAFSKRAYGKEMESQRTILSDLLDGAQGFAQCTEPPFAQECDLAISSAVDRLRDLHRQWEPILSHSALLQSLGSLLSTLIHKFIVDVEDMSDISEPESQRLTSFCNRVATLEDLFMPQSQSGAQLRDDERIPLTAVYTPGWLKFQYLANILESSLVDIKFLWEEGELSLEFDIDELVELIEALFADSEHRRRAIGEMRRVSGSR